LSPVAQTLMRLGAEGEWRGQPTVLLRRLNEMVPDDTRYSPGWPRNEKALKNVVQRLMPSLRHAGVVVDYGRAGGTRTYSVRPARAAHRAEAAQAAQAAHEPGVNGKGHHGAVPHVPHVPGESGPLHAEDYEERAAIIEFDGGEPRQ